MIYVYGDTHGGETAYELNNRMWKEQNNLTENDLLVILGDFGYLWDSSMSEKEQCQLNVFANKKYNVAFIDGNHENFNRVNALPAKDLWGGNVGVIECDRGNVYHLKRGEVYTFNNKKIFTMGGALSVDRWNRYNQISWWPEEAHSNADVDNALNNLEKHNYEVDYVLTHTAPSSIIKKILPKALKHNNDPASLFLEDLTEKNLQFTDWWFGHFHENITIDDKFHCHFNTTPKAIF